MKSFIHLIVCFMAIVPLNETYGQHHQTKANESRSLPHQKLSFEAVLSQALSDPELSDYHLQATVMTIVPGAVDTVSHRHDCELFGYVLEGEVEVALVTKEPTVYRTGEMFYEKRNVLHTLTRNRKRDLEAKVLLLFIIKNGRSGYVAEYPKKAN